MTAVSAPSTPPPIAGSAAEGAAAAATPPPFAEGHRQRIPGSARGPLHRDLFDPFDGVTADPAWLAWHGGAIPTLAPPVSEERELPSGHLDVGRLAVLADMLEEAGAVDPQLLGHLRGPGPHVRGCWAVDALPGRS